MLLSVRPCRAAAAGLVALVAAGLLVATPKQALGWECGGARGKSEQLPQCPFLQLTWHQIFELDEVNRKHAICRHVIFIDNLFEAQ